MLSQEKIAQLYETIYLIRKCEETIRDEYAQDQMKTPVHLCVGAEAIAAGVLGSLPKGAQIFGTYRNHGLYLAQTGDTDGFFAELYGKSSGCSGGKAGSMHMAYPEKGLMMTSAVVATTIPVAVGAALAHAYRGEDHLTAVFFGEGALEEGAFWESVNFACLHRLKILFVCEDNGLAIHTPVHERQGFRSILDVMGAFKCHALQAAGQDAADVVEKTERLVQWMTAPKTAMPGFLYVPYYRFLEHVGVQEDFQAKYRLKPEQKELEAMDPLRCAESLAQKAGVSLAALKAIRQQVDSQVGQSLEKAKTAPFPKPDSLEMQPVQRGL